MKLLFMLIGIYWVAQKILYPFVRVILCGFGYLLFNLCLMDWKKARAKPWKCFNYQLLIFWEGVRIGWAESSCVEISAGGWRWVPPIWVSRVHRG